MKLNIKLLILLLILILSTYCNTDESQKIDVHDQKHMKPEDADPADKLLEYAHPGKDYPEELEKYAQMEDMHIDMDNFDFNDPDADNKLLAFGTFQKDDDYPLTKGQQEDWNMLAKQDGAPSYDQMWNISPNSQFIKSFKNDAYQKEILSYHHLDNTKDEKKIKALVDNFRFMGVENKEQAFEKLKGFITTSKKPVDNLSCWSSSRWDVYYYKKRWCRCRWSWGHWCWRPWYRCDYRAHSVLGHPCKSKNVPGYARHPWWLSADLESKRSQEEVQFIARFEDYSRVTDVYVAWWIAPRQFGIQGQNSDSRWFQMIQVGDINKLNNPNNYIGNRITYTQSFPIEEPQFITAIKLQMKIPKAGRRIGFMNVQAFVENLHCMIHAPDSHESCVARSEINYFKNGDTVQVMNCLDAIGLGDGREIFVIDFTLQLQSYIDKFCIFPQNGEFQDKSTLKMYDCSEASKKGTREEDWSFAARGVAKTFQIHNAKHRGLKWESESDETYDNVASSANGAVAQASSVANTPINYPKRMIDNSEEPWISIPGESKVSVSIMLAQPSTVNVIKISFKFKPDTFELFLIKKGGQKESMTKVSSNQQDDFELRFPHTLINGIFIRFDKHHETSEVAQSLAYGINNIEILRSARKLVLKEQTADKWEIEIVKFSNIEVYIPWNVEFTILTDSTNNLIEMLDQIIKIKPYIGQAISDSLIINEKMQKYTEQLDDFDKRLAFYKLQMLESQKDDPNADLPSNLGCSPKNPADACWRIIDKFPWKKSGYYWIKPSCSKIPMRVYCDFASKDQQAYAYIMNDSQDMSGLKQVRHWCGTIGLEPVEIHEEQLDTVIEYLNDIGIDLTTAAPIPLGYDYKCLKGQQYCEGKFRSFNNIKSDDISSKLISRLDKMNILNLPFSIMGKQRDAIGIAMSKSKLLRINMSNANIKGIICSTNARPGMVRSNAKKVECDTKVRGNQDFQGILNTNIKVYCPKECASKDEYHVFGTDRFSDESSICRAGIHIGAISDDKGGEMYISISDDVSQYDQENKNSIQTKKLKTQGQYNSFVIRKIDNSCPQDDEYLEPSFLQENMSIKSHKKSRVKRRTTLSRNLKLRKNRIQHQYKKSRKHKKAQVLRFANKYHKMSQQVEAQSQFNNGTIYNYNSCNDQDQDEFNFLQVAANSTYQDVLNKMLVKNKEQRQSNLDKTNDILRNISSLMQFANTKNDDGEDDSGGDEGDDGGEDSKSGGSGEKGSEEEEGGEDPVDTKMTTKDAIEYVEALYDKGEHELSRQVKLVQDAEALFSMVANMIAPCVDTSQDPHKQYQEIVSIENHVTGTQAFTNELTQLAQAKRAKEFRSYQIKLLEKIELMKWEPYIEQYFFLITDIYQIWDGNNAQNKPSKWKFTTEGLKGHDMAISQESAISSKNNVPTVLQLKFKIWSDLSFAFSFRIKDSGRGGVVFRFHDVFNYYFLECDKQSCLAGKFVHGNRHEIMTFEKKFEQDKWQRFLIHAQQFIFKVYHAEENKPTDEVIVDYDRHQFLFQFEDHDLASGYLGFTSNGSKGINWDQIHVAPHEVQFEAQLDDTKYAPPATCNRFRENYQISNTAVVYDIREPVAKTFNGPQKWVYVPSVEGKLKALCQESQVFTKDEKKIGVIALFNKKFFKEGYIKLNFLMKDNGRIGVAIRYKNENDFTFIEIRKQELIVKFKSGEQLKELAKAQIACALNVWYSLKLVVIGDVLQVFFGQENQVMEELFEDGQELATDSEPNILGQAGIMTWKTAACFDAIQMHPETDINPTLSGIEGEDEDLEDFEDIDISGTRGAIMIDQNSFDGPPIKVENDMIKDIEYKACIENDTHDRRKVYCQNQFFASDAQENCIEKFCPVCCSEFFDPVQQIQNSKCTKECESKTVINEEFLIQPYDQCLQSKYLKQSIGSYCGGAYIDQKDQIDCVYEFAKLCCSVSSNLFQTPLTEQSVNNCVDAATEQYQDSIREYEDTMRPDFIVPVDEEDVEAQKEKESQEHFAKLAEQKNSKRKRKLRKMKKLLRR